VGEFGFDLSESIDTEKVKHSRSQQGGAHHDGKTNRFPGNAGVVCAGNGGIHHGSPFSPLSMMIRIWGPGGQIANPLFAKSALVKMTHYQNGLRTHQEHCIIVSARGPRAVHCKLRCSASNRSRENDMAENIWVTLNPRELTVILDALTSMRNAGRMDHAEFDALAGKLARGTPPPASP
jgi:hypothetical protein